MKLQKLREIIIKANPEIREYAKRCMSCGYGFEFCKCTPKKTEWFEDRPIRLADVLLAIPDNYVDVQLSKPLLLLINHDKNNNSVYWDISKDDLNLQDEPTIDFLLELLSNEE